MGRNTYKKRMSRPSPLCRIERRRYAPPQLFITKANDLLLPQTAATKSSTLKDARSLPLNATRRLFLVKLSLSSKDQTVSMSKPADAKNRQAKALSTQRGPVQCHMSSSRQQDHSDPSMQQRLQSSSFAGDRKLLGSTSEVCLHQR